MGFVQWGCLNRSSGKRELDRERTLSELARFVAALNDGIQIASRAQVGEEKLRRIARMVEDTVY
ncbi:hypothetical protein [uncultured Ruegeria sp.]|uniref:hypothetical protein n=1 Tax=uncultured Ruegeria sp. TaxID=259304 RepID=UPI00261396A6|nr:hypothetical protein [uncultured Ruegeria sp.]